MSRGKKVATLSFPSSPISFQWVPYKFHSPTPPFPSPIIPTAQLSRKERRRRQGCKSDKGKRFFSIFYSGKNSSAWDRQEKKETRACSNVQFTVQSGKNIATTISHIFSFLLVNFPSILCTSRQREKSCITQKQKIWIFPPLVPPSQFSFPSHSRSLLA